MMRLATLRTQEGPRAVVLRGQKAVLVDGHADVGELLRGGPAGIETARRAHDGEPGRPFSSDELLRPVLAPGAVACVGLNYRTHILEMGRELPTSPTLFCKLARALTDPFAEIDLPPASQKVDYEGELAIVISNGGRNVPSQRAWDHVAGLTVLNDVTMRDFQRRTVQWFAGKTFQRSTPVGPWITTPDEFGDTTGRELLVTVNGEERQRASLEDLVFDVPSLVADLSTIVELEPGDIIATGTPGGVGDASKTYLSPGDTVEVSIGGIGTIRNTFRTGHA